MKLSTFFASLSALGALVFATPYMPKGGLGTNSTPPVYQPLSDFDFQSIVSILSVVETFPLRPIISSEFGVKSGMD